MGGLMYPTILDTHSAHQYRMSNILPWEVAGEAEAGGTWRPGKGQPLCLGPEMSPYEDFLLPQALIHGVTPVMS